MDTADERGIRGSRIRYDVIVDRQIRVDEEDRVYWAGRYLEIRGLRNGERVDELPVLECEGAV